MDNFHERGKRSLSLSAIILRGSKNERKEKRKKLKRRVRGNSADTLRCALQSFANNSRGEGAIMAKFVESLRIEFWKIEEIKRKVDCTGICSSHHECLILFIVIAIFVIPYNVIFKLSTISLEFDILILLFYFLFHYFACFGEK